MEWIATMLASGVAKGVLGVFGDTIVQPFLQAYLKGKDVDLDKFKESGANTTQLAQAVLNANIEFAKIKSAYALSILQWWPFRLILFALLFFPTLHFCMIVADSSIIWFFSGRYGVFGAPAVPKDYLDIEFQLLLFFVIAKPVDSAVNGAISALRAYLERRK